MSKNVLRKSEKEEKYYSIIKDKLEQLFRGKKADVYLEITAKGTFSDILKAKIPLGYEIIFSFLKKAVPDIAGFVEGSRQPGFVIVEVKKNKIELDDIYQLKKYADLFEARFAFLVSLKPIPEDIKRLCKTPLFLLAKLRYTCEAFTLVYFNEASGEFEEWFEKNPFIESSYWR